MIKGCLPVLAVFVATIVLGIATLWFIQRPLHKTPFFVRLVVDMRVNEEPVHIERILECRTFAGSRGDASLSFGKRGPTRYAATVGAIGKRLSDGSAVMMWTPYLCAREKNTETGALEPVGFPNGRLPFMGWMPDVDSRKTLEIYPSPAYFSKPYARIRSLKISVQNVPSGVRPDPPDSFEWFTKQTLKGENRERTRDHFFGVSRLTLTESEWRGKNSYLDRLFESLNEPKIFQAVYRDYDKGRKIDKAASRTFVEINVIFNKIVGPFVLPTQERTNAMHLFRQQQHVQGHDPEAFPLISLRSISNNEVIFIGENSIYEKKITQI